MNVHFDNVTFTGCGIKLARNVTSTLDRELVRCRPCKDSAGFKVGA